jgi:hypothetical protein
MRRFNSAIRENLTATSGLIQVQGRGIKRHKIASAMVLDRGLGILDRRLAIPSAIADPTIYSLV